MTERHATEAAQWETSPELPPGVLHALRQPLGETVAIVATVDADGAPRTAAFGSVVPVTPAKLRFGCNREHATFANLVREGRVMLAVFAPPDVAVGIRGRARLLREQIGSWPSDAVIEVDVHEVKNDALPFAPIATGITYDLPEDVAVRLERYMAEVGSGERGEAAG